MKKFFKTIGIILLLIVAFVLIAGLLISKDCNFETSVSINAPQEKVWANVNSLGGMDKWSPWNDKDPNMQKTMSGTDGTVGAVYSWKGNKDVGEGSQTIEKLDPPNRIDTKLHFLKPFDSKADAYVIVAPEGSGSKVTWGFKSQMPYPFNVMKLFMNFKKEMDKEFGSGLKKLKAISESGQ